MHVVDRGRLRCRNRLVERSDLVPISLSVIRRGVFIDETPQVRVRLIPTVIPFGHRMRSNLGVEELLAGMWFFLRHDSRLLDFQDRGLALAVAIHGSFEELAELTDHALDV